MTRPYTDPPGRLDVRGIEWYACDPYPCWYRWENGELKFPAARHYWADECIKGLPAVTPRIAARFDPNRHNCMMLFGEGWRPVFLYGPDPFCKHELNKWIYSGINCKYCQGWYCA